MRRSRALKAAAALLVSAVLSGCACFEEVLRPEPKQAARPRKIALLETSADAQRKWCIARYDDYLAGRRPGGAETLEQKREHDRICAPLLGHVKAGP